jgi:hypothetical protein
MFRKFRERTRRMQEELTQKRAANAAARVKLFIDTIAQAEKIEDPDFRKLALERLRNVVKQRPGTPFR